MHNRPTSITGIITGIITSNIEVAVRVCAGATRTGFQSAR